MVTSRGANHQAKLLSRVCEGHGNVQIGHVCQVAQVRAINVFEDNINRQISAELYFKFIDNAVRGEKLFLMTCPPPAVPS